MKKIGTIAICILISGFIAALTANENQQHVITGTVTDETGSEMVGVNVKVKGGVIGTMTNWDGEYTISVLSLSGTLVFTQLGYETVEVDINGSTTINVELSTNIFDDPGAGGCNVDWSNCDHCDYPGGLGYLYCGRTVTSNTCNYGGVTCDCSHSCNTFGCSAYSASLGCNCMVGLCYC